jgi:glycerophosphoryl diester phosphodiesterase
MEPFVKIAHRGYSSEYPENTILAFAKAVAAGADMIELDVHLSRDGKLVVIHDDFIDRTSDGTGAVTELTLAELRQHSYNNAMERHGFVGIPTLEEVIAWAPERLLINVEIKNCPIRHEGIEQKLVDLFAETRFADRVIVSSFDHYALAEMKRIAPAVKTAIIYDSVWTTFEEEVHTLGVYSVHPGRDAIRPDQLRWAKARGVKVYPWVVKDRKTLAAYKESGYVDGAMVNDMTLFSEP